MRFIQLLTAPLLVLSFLFVFTACGDTTADADTAVETTAQAPHGEGKEFTSAYVCPMHCDGSGSDQAGECPVCGMDYVAQTEHTENGHQH
jgi:hypothetical protein